MRILLDVMGGDLPPQELVRGGIDVARRRGIELVFAGDPAVIRPVLTKGGKGDRTRFEVLPCRSVIRMDDRPVKAVREKWDSSLVLGLNALKDGEVDAFVSPGNTGAIVVASLFVLGRISGIPRPGILVPLPTLVGKEIIVIDVGANSDSTPEQLVHFALMGSAYARDVLGIANPTIGLLNIGTEREKGNRLIGKAFALLERGPFRFVGNVEAHSLLSERPVDVVVSDGFVGNVFLKAVEGGVAAVTGLLRRSIRGRPVAMLGALLMSGAFARVKGSLSYHRRGGAPLLGVNGLVVIAHGRSDAEAIGSAVEVALREAESDLLTRLRHGIEGWEPDGS